MLYSKKVGSGFRFTGKQRASEMTMSSTAATEPPTTSIRVLSSQALDERVSRTGWLGCRLAWPRERDCAAEMSSRRII